MIIDDHKVIIDGENVIYVRYGFWPARGRVKKILIYSKLVEIELFEIFFENQILLEIQTTNFDPNFEI